MKRLGGHSLPKGQPADPEAWERALNALAGGANMTETSRQSGYSLVHIHRLLKKPEFEAELERRKREAGPVSTKDEDLATQVLRDMAEGAESERDRIMAAKALLEWATRRKPMVMPPIIKIEPPSTASDEEEAKKWRSS